MFNELNKNVTAGAKYVKLQDLVGHPALQVTRATFQDGKYGTNAVLYAPVENLLISMPRWANKTIQTVLNTPIMAQAMAEGHMGIGNIRELVTKNGATVTFDYMDM